MTTTTAGPELLSESDVFVSGSEGYHTIRIPTVATTADGSLVVASEARVYSSHDPGFADNEVHLVCSRSEDRGATWSPLQLVENPGDRWAVCNPTLLFDRKTARLWLFHCRTKPGRSSATSRPGTDDAHVNVRYSADRGETWSAPVDITDSAMDVDGWGSAFYGPGGAIQTRTGRLLAPMVRVSADIPWNTYAVFSDDHGESWQRGQLVPDGDWGSESQLVELSDGRILFDIRQNEGPRRWLATSDDGGETWSTPRPGEAVTPVCCGIERGGRGAGRIVWTGPKGPDRSHLVARFSDDDGETFTEELALSQGYAAYSDLTILDDGTAGVVWERGAGSAYQFVTFSRFSIG